MNSRTFRKLIRSYWQSALFVILLLILLARSRFSMHLLYVYMMQTAALFPAVLGEALIYMAAGADLSCGSTVSMEMSILSLLILMYRLPLLIILPLFVMIVFLIGYLKDLLASYMKVPYEIITLILHFIVMPLADLIHTYSTGFDTARISLGGFSLFIIFAMVFSAAFMWLFLNFTTYGKSIFILGSLRTICRASGMNDKALRRIAVMTGTMLGAFTAFNMIIRTGIPTYINGNNLTFQVICALAMISSGSLSCANFPVRCFLSSAITVMITAVIQSSGLSTMVNLAAYGIVIVFSFWMQTIKEKS